MGSLCTIPFHYIYRPVIQLIFHPLFQVDMWCDDSDDDDLILLASQQVEQNAAPPNFQSFLNDVNSDSKTSTQQQNESQMPVSVNVALRAKVTSSVVLNNQDKASQDFLRKRIESLDMDIQRTKEEN